MPYRVAKFVRRNRSSVVAALLVAIGLIGTSAFALTQMYSARAQRDIALAEAKHANAQADLTQYILDDKLSRLSPEAESERLHRARQFVAARFRNQPLLAARLLIDVSGDYIDIGDFRTGADIAAEAERSGIASMMRVFLGNSPAFARKISPSPVISLRRARSLLRASCKCGGSIRCLRT